MSEPKNVLVAVGKGETPKLPRQNYENIFTKYNMPVGIAAATVPDHDFFNLTMSEGGGLEDAPYVLGFLKGNYSYSSPSSVQKIVDLFSMDDDIEIVTTDVLVSKVGNNARFIEHGHSEAISDLPFFIRNTIVEEVSFEDSAEIFKATLEELVQRRSKKIYHIGEPLLVAEIRA
tara:strand:+ start:72405 stop:72926 length:522 start_codon:yes stop_codon:yes gene_type:complete